MHGFESSFRRHLVVEQRRAVLEALAKKLGPDVTMGDVLDAADGLGWSEPMGELTLADLAEALLRPPKRPGGPVAVQAEADEEDEEAPADEEAQEAEAATKSKAKTRTRSKGRSAPETKARAKGPAASKAEAKSKSKGEAESTSKTRSKSTAKGKSGVAKASIKSKTARLKALRAKVDAEDRMSLDEAAELLVPIVEELGQATMQDLEDFTGIGRRKLRFHIGQLVRHEYLERHGMGRGTYYTASE